MFFDSHNHLQDPRLKKDREAIIQEMLEAGVARCVVNGTREADWPEVRALAQQYPDLVTPSYGLHPWHLESRAERWRETLKDLLTENSRSCIGECGLDRWMKNYDLDLQQEIFQQHLELAAELSRPVTIHCLRAWGPLIEALKKCSVLPQKILLHSFAGSIETAGELLKFGAHFSFSGHFLHPRKEKFRACFQQLPADRILVETDAPDMSPPSPKFQLEDLNHPANLAAIAEECARLLKIPVEQFEQNSQRFFNP